MSNSGGNGQFFGDVASRAQQSAERHAELPSVAGRVPPHDLDAEAAVLSAMLLDESALYLALERLKREHFYSTANELIFEAAVECSVDVPPNVDAVTVVAKLRAKQVIQRVGGSRYVAQIVDATPAVHHLDRHIDIVFDCWRLRRLIASCQRIAAEGYGDTGPIQSFIDGAEQEIYEIARGPERNEASTLGEVLTETFAKMAAAADRGEKITGVSTGFTDLDKAMAGLHDSDLLIVAGRPGHGKTSLALNMAINIAAGPDPYAAAVFSLEMDKESLGKRAVCGEARVDANKLRHGTLAPDDWAQLTAAAGAIGAMHIWIDDQAALTLMQLRGKIRRLAAKAAQLRSSKDDPMPHKLVAIVDYLTLMSGPKGNGREQEVSELSRGLKAIAKEFAIPLVVIAQLNRGVETRGGDKRPILSDLRDSGAIEQDADAIVFVFREELYKPDVASVKGLAELIIGKQRHGPTGAVQLRYTPSYTRFDNLAPSEWSEYGDD
ncbi:MAG: replicative DNA helicase [Planctomycetota bacterium]